MVMLTNTERGLLSDDNNIILASSGGSQNFTSYNSSSGAITSATASTATIASGADDAYNNQVIEIISGKGRNQSRLITDLTSLVANISPDWDIIPDSTSKYVIHVHSGKCQVQDQDNLDTTIKLSTTASSVNNFYQKCFLKILYGCGINQISEIISYDGTTKIATIYPEVSCCPRSNSLYAIYGESGTSPNTGGANDATHIVLDANHTTLVGQYLYIEIYDGTGNGQTRMISSISTDTVTVSSAWVTIPDNTSKYNMFSGWAPAVYEDVLKHAIITIASDYKFLDGERSIISMESSMDEFGTYKISQLTELSSIVPSNIHAITVSANYFRLKIIAMGTDLNGSTQTTVNSYKSGKLTSQLEENVSENNDCELVRAVITGKTTAGTYNNILSDSFGNLQVSISNPDESYGSITSVLPYQIIELFFTNNIINIYQVETHTKNNGTVSAINNIAEINTTSDTLGMATLYSIKRVKNIPGLAFSIRFSAVFSSPIAQSTQIIGFGDHSNGVFFGYNGTSFGILQRSGGKAEIRRLTITAGSSLADNITITLNGDTSGNIALGLSDSVAQVVRKIANSQSLFTNLGDGWDLYEQNDTIIFVSKTAGSKSGSYTYNPGTTSSTGSFSSEVTGVSPTNTWVVQNEWSYDRGLGIKDLPYINWQKGNVFEISFQGLEFGDIIFKIENPNSGHFIVVHKIAKLNSLTDAVIENPILPLCVYVDKTGGSDADIIKIKTGSMGVYIMGNYNKLLGTIFGISNIYSSVSGALSASTYYNVLSIRNNRLFNSSINFSELFIMSISLSFVGGTAVSRGGIFTFFTGVQLNDSVSITWTARDASYSPVDYCQDVVTFTGGHELISYGTGSNAQISHITTEVEFFIPPGQVLTIAFKPVVGLLTTPSTNIGDISASVVWIRR